LMFMLATIAPGVDAATLYAQSSSDIAFSVSVPDMAGGGLEVTADATRGMLAYSTDDEVLGTWSIFVALGVAGDELPPGLELWVEADMAAVPANCGATLGPALVGSSPSPFISGISAGCADVEVPLEYSVEISDIGRLVAGEPRAIVVVFVISQD